MIRYALALLCLAPVSVTAQAVRLNDINSGALGSGIQVVERFGSRAYFGACSETQCSLWQTDGTQGEIRRTQTDFVVEALVASGDWLYAIEGSATLPRLFRTEGDRPDLVSTPTGPVLPTELGVVLEASQKDGVFVFGAMGNAGAEPWLTDPMGFTLRLADINPNGSSNPDGFVSVGDFIVFWANDGTAGRELWRTSGAMTSRLSDLNPGAGSSFVAHDRAMLGDWLYLVADDGARGPEVWRTDGTALEIVIDLQPGALGSAPRSFTRAGDWVYFAADDGSAGRQIWRTDGTTTERVSDLASGAAILDLAPLGDGVYAVADEGQGLGRELYRTTDGLTTLVADLAPGAASGFPDGLDADTLDSKLYLRAFRPDVGEELFMVSDTDALSLAADIQEGAGGSMPTFITSLDGHLFFVADDGTRGAEPYGFTPLPPLAGETPAGRSALALNVAPNPLRGAGAVTLDMPAPDHARIALVDALGREVEVLHNGPLARGPHRLSLPGGLPPGLYVVRADAAGGGRVGAPDGRAVGRASGAKGSARGCRPWAPAA